VGLEKGVMLCLHNDGFAKEVMILQAFVLMLTLANADESKLGT
jgi:hypothetical protein